MREFNKHYWFQTLILLAFILWFVTPFFAHEPKPVLIKVSAKNFECEESRPFLAIASLNKIIKDIDSKKRNLQNSMMTAEKKSLKEIETNVILLQHQLARDATENMVAYITYNKCFKSAEFYELMDKLSRNLENINYRYKKVSPSINL